MKGIVFAAAAIAIGVSAGLAAPFIAGKVKDEIGEATRPAPAARRAEAPTSDPGGLVGAAETPRAPARNPPVAVPAPAKAAPVAQPKPAEPPAKWVPTRVAREAASRKLDCRKYVPKAQVTISVPCDGKKSEEGEQKDGDDKKETKKSRKEKKASAEADDAADTATTGTCRQYVTRAGLTRIQNVPCNSPRTAQASRR